MRAPATRGAVAGAWRVRSLSGGFVQTCEGVIEVKSVVPVAARSRSTRRVSYVEKGQQHRGIEGHAPAVIAGSLCSLSQVLAHRLLRSLSLVRQANGISTGGTAGLGRCWGAPVRGQSHPPIAASSSAAHPLGPCSSASWPHRSHRTLIVSPFCRPPGNLARPLSHQHEHWSDVHAMLHRPRLDVPDMQALALIAPPVLGQTFVHAVVPHPCYLRHWSVRYRPASSATYSMSLRGLRSRPHATQRGGCP